MVNVQAGDVGARHENATSVVVVAFSCHVFAKTAPKTHCTLCSKEKAGGFRAVFQEKEFQWKCLMTTERHINKKRRGWRTSPWRQKAMDLVQRQLMQQNDPQLCAEWI
nr:hypothetical protein [Tanacetum cinerariifolium]